MDRPASHQLSRRRSRAVAPTCWPSIAAGVEAVSPRVLMPRVAVAVRQAAASGPAGLHVVAVGKAAAGMFEAVRGGAACCHRPGRGHRSAPARRLGGSGERSWKPGIRLPPRAASRAARLALEIAAAVPADGCLVCLLSGGASALMAAPLPGLSLAAKQQAVAHVMTGGADIAALNAVRKHLSRVKGGRLAAACRGAVVTYAISDVIGDDLSVIGSGPCVPDWSTWHDAAEAVERFGGWDGLAPEVRQVIDAGRRGAIADTPKAGDARLARATAEVIGGRRQAMDGAARAAAARGYTPVVLDQAVRGEARLSAPDWWRSALAVAAGAGRPARGHLERRDHGAGHRAAVAAAAIRSSRSRWSRRSRPTRPAPSWPRSAPTASMAPPTQPARVVDAGTCGRAAAHGLRALAVLDANDSYAYFAAAGDLVRTGATGTNVGDLQILLTGPA